MSNLELNLKVLTDYLGELGVQHQKATDLITGANRSVADIVSKIERTHGLICWSTIQALSGGEPRKVAGDTIGKVSAEFTEKLGRAATNYNDVDYREGRSIGAAGTACQT
ncbi:ESX-1 secretion-associated protein [Mycolicibacterium fortuitum]|uniref:ESX-1 secretion-associated protein n=1 Tax=Mycolicibacterium fortuitum TaxID=1766 RepID=UPI001CDBCB8F|nr:ESX-1 secretion-associated protein [Mycolicibacterium fortuitum]